MSQDALVCARCQPMEAAVAEKDLALRSLSDELEATREELAGARGTIRSVEKQRDSARRDLTRAREDSPKAKVILGILEHWKHTTGHPGAKIPLDGERAKLVAGKLKTYEATFLTEAISGLALLPYVVSKRRVAYGTPAERYDDVVHCIGTEERIEKNRRVWLRAQEAASRPNIDRLWECQQHHSAMAGHYMLLISQECCRRELEAGNEVVADNVVRLKEIAAVVDDRLKDAA